MLGCVYNKGKVELIELDKPVLTNGVGAILKVAACSICGTDIRAYRFGNGRILDGQIIGHEVVGEIVEIAEPHDTSFSIGDKVAIAPAIGCGVCNSCKKGRSNMCTSLKTIGFDFSGGFAEYTAIPDSAFVMGNVYILPDGSDYSQYTLCEPLACAINGQSYLNIKSGDDVVIFGSGVVGCFHAELSCLAGAARTVIIEPSTERLNEAERLLKELPVTFVNPVEVDIKKAVREIFGGKGADVAIVACSVASAQAQGFELLENLGRISLFGGVPGDPPMFDGNLVHYKELSVFGAHASTPKQNQQAMELAKTGKINLEKYITGRYQLADIMQVFDKCVNGEIMKAIIVN